MLITLMIFMAFARPSFANLIGICNQCSPNNKVACLDETHFAICFDGVPNGTITKCPDNNFCTNDLHICRSADKGYKPICYESCGSCEVTNRIYTCLNETTYSFCYGSKSPQKNSLSSCPMGYVCSYNFKNICVPEALNQPSCGPKITNKMSINTLTTTIPATTDQTSSTTQLPTTTSEIIKTTTTTSTNTTSIQGNPPTKSKTAISAKNKPRNANALCKDFGRKGYFKSEDPTCRKYVYCYLLSGQYLGWFFYCDGYFNGTTQKCQNEIPPNCVAY